MKEEIIAKNFVKYSMMKENFNIQDMYKEINNETKIIFREAAKSVMFKTEEKNDSLNIVKAFNNEDAEEKSL
ncbi:MAG: hypothetical protein J6A28_00785 [Clostridia bacterium]|nr:hypothetical protein [Clostridia bacterium]